MCKCMCTHVHIYTLILCGYMCGWWGGEDGDGRVFDWKARCMCRNACEWPLPGKGQLHPALFSLCQVSVL